MSFNFQKGELILIDKELEWTSFDVVNKLRSSIKRKLKISDKDNKIYGEDSIISIKSNESKISLSLKLISSYFFEL